MFSYVYLSDVPTEKNVGKNGWTWHWHEIKTYEKRIMKCLWNKHFYFHSHWYWKLVWNSNQTFWTTFVLFVSKLPFLLTYCNKWQWLRCVHAPVSASITKKEENSYIHTRDFTYQILLDTRVCVIMSILVPLTIEQRKTDTYV